MTDQKIKAQLGKQAMHKHGQNSHTFDMMTVILRKQLCHTGVKNKNTDNFRTGRDHQILNPEFPKPSLKKA